MVKTALIIARKPVPTNPKFSFLILNTGEQIVASTSESEGQVAVSYEEHRKGSKFKATRDSSRKDENGNPIYLKNEEVERLKDFIEIKGYTTIEVWKSLQ